MALQQQQEKLKIEENNLALEEGRQVVARQECEMLQQGEDNIPIKQDDLDLALRKPQLQMQKAMVESARAAVKKAELMLERTEIKAPFDAVVQSADVDIGDQVSPAKVLGRLVYTGVYWVRVSVKISDLHWIFIAGEGKENGSKVVISLAGGRIKNGTVIKRLPDIEPYGRMARLLVAVENPLKVDSVYGRNMPMLLGEYVRARIFGPEEKNVYRIPREALRDDNKLWLLTEDRHLKVVDADLVWADRDMVTVRKNWDAGARLIVSDLDVVVDGMKLRDVNDAEPPSEIEEMPGDGGEKILTIKNNGDK